jgi:RNA polymerase sigma-B factor
MMNNGGDAERWDRKRTQETFSRLVGARASDEALCERLREELVVAHGNLVRFLAMKFSNRGESIEDLVQVGMLGLIKAIDRFDVDRGVEFTTYATPTILGEIKRHFRDKGWALKVPRRLQELNLTVNKALEKLTMELGHSPTVAELAQHLHATQEEILEAQELGQAYNLLSIDTEHSGESEGKSHTLSDYVGKNDPALELFEDRANIEKALKELAPRERVIIYLRFYESVSQAEIAKRLSCSQMHISRLQARALEKLRLVLQES